MIAQYPGLYGYRPGQIVYDLEPAHLPGDGSQPWLGIIIIAACSVGFGFMTWAAITLWWKI